MERLLTLKEVLEAVGLSKATWYAYIQAGLAPAPRKLPGGPRRALAGKRDNRVDQEPGEVDRRPGPLGAGGTMPRRMLIVRAGSRRNLLCTRCKAEATVVYPAVPRPEQFVPLCDGCDDDRP